jgi:TolC family type I secretion outer membrane protein
MNSFWSGVRASLLACVVFVPVLGAGAASAESLFEAMAKAYEGNPTLRAERARQRATDEQVPQALSGWRPVVRAEGSTSITETETNDISPDAVFNSNLSITLTQPLFRGFKTVNGTKQAEANVEAGKQNLLSVEQNVLFQAVQAYANVVRDRQIVSLRQKNVSVLQQQLRATNERFNVGEVTRTDVAQARASVAQSQADLASAKATLASSIASYERIIGHKPGTLKAPAIAKLPKSLESALAEARRINPNLLAAAFIEEAAYHNIGVVMGDMLPEASLVASASLSRQEQSDTATIWQEQALVRGVVTVPLYLGGGVSSRVREAKQVESQRRIQVIETQRSVRESVTSSWNAFVESGERIRAAKAQVSAARLALDGVRQEYVVGSRTTQDVLDAEQDVLDAQISLVAAQRDRVVAAYQVIGSVGKLTARNLHLSVNYYDPDENYLEVRDKWFGVKANTVE